MDLHDLQKEFISRARLLKGQNQDARMRGLEALFAELEKRRTEGMVLFGLRKAMGRVSR